MASISWWHLVVLVLAMALIALLVVFAVRSWRRRAVDSVIGLTLTGSAFYAAVVLIVAVGTVVDVLTSPEITITIPVNEYWPTLPPGVKITSGPTATRVGGGFTSAEVQLRGLTTGTRMLWAGGQAAGLLVQVAVAGLIALACFQLLRGAAFARAVARVAMITAVVVLVGGLASAVMSDVAASLASAQLLTVTSAAATNVPAGWDPTTLLPQPTLHIDFPLWPIGAALGFAALAAVLRYGAKLQRDTEGLV